MVLNICVKGQLFIDLNNKPVQELIKSGLLITPTSHCLKNQWLVYKINLNFSTYYFIRLKFPIKYLTSFILSFYGFSSWANTTASTNNDNFQIIVVTLISIVVITVLGRAYFKSQLQQKEEKSRFKNIVENAKDFIYTTDVKGNIDFVNEAAIIFTGYTKEELIGKNYKFFVREDYKHPIEAFYKKQIREKIKESFKEFPITKKNGNTIWVSQSVFFKYAPDFTYIGAEIICRDVTERVMAEERLKFHNRDLKVINRVKETILASDQTINMYIEILLLLGAHSDKTNFFSINIFDRYSATLHTYSLSTKDQSVKSINNPVDRKLAENLKRKIQNVFDFENEPQEASFFKALHQPTDKYKSAVIAPVYGNDKLFGFIGFFSSENNAYQEDHSIMVKDIATSLCSFFVQYEQKQIIRDYSRQLEILNESKTRLLSCNTINEVFKGIIELLYKEINNVYRVSILVHDLEKQIGNLIYKDDKSPDLLSKIISTKNIPTLPYHIKNQVFEKFDLDADNDLTEEDLIWKAKGIKSIISLPLTINGTLYASVNLLSPIAYNFTEQETALIKEINESAANVIEQLNYKEIISEKNKDISDNINYAKRIQSALMPSEDFLNSILKKSFLIFSQRDSLGGDFYWFDKLDDNIFIAVGDCTGHGVSGSLLTILATDYIKQAVEVKKFTDPGLVLEHVRDSMHRTLNKYSDDEIVDGLDISFGVFNVKTKTFLYASAMHYFYLVRNNELTEYKGNRKPIGGSAAMENSYYFTTHLFQLQENDLVYFTTDGYIDQLHQKSEKRFGKNRFKQLLLLISDKSIEEQKTILIKQHEKWKGNLNQTDDICLMGFKV